MFLSGIRFRILDLLLYRAAVSWAVSSAAGAWRCRPVPGPLSCSSRHGINDVTVLATPTVTSLPGNPPTPVANERSVIDSSLEWINNAERIRAGSEKRIRFGRVLVYKSSTVFVNCICFCFLNIESTFGHFLLQEENDPRLTYYAKNVPVTSALCLSFGRFRNLPKSCRVP